MSVSGRLYPIGIALLLLVIATCTDFDNPVAVEGLSVESLLPTAVSADGGQQAADTAGRQDRRVVRPEASGRLELLRRSHPERDHHPHA